MKLLVSLGPFDLEASFCSEPIRGSSTVHLPQTVIAGDFLKAQVPGPLLAEPLFTIRLSNGEDDMSKKRSRDLVDVSGPSATRQKKAACP